MALAQSPNSMYQKRGGKSRRCLVAVVVVVVVGLVGLMLAAEEAVVVGVAVLWGFCGDDCASAAALLLPSMVGSF